MCTFSSQEWARLRGHYDLVNQQHERAHAAGRTFGQNPTRAGRGRGCTNTDDFPTRSIQALQQANSILSEITANLSSCEQALPPPPNDDTSNAGNSFGIASYGGRYTCYDNSAGRGPRTTSKVSTMTRWLIGVSHAHLALNPTIIEANSEIDNHADTCCLGANFYRPSHG